MLDGHLLQSLAWQKASASVPGGMCVEVAPYEENIALRDSKCPEQGAFLYTRAEFAAFLDGCRRGEFDHLEQ
ncbi:DUF397 domain-containing protein [Actinomycetospora sp. NBRC 106378]|uniref:DUF397 domain-containing protein n=1 Tax=Actinomycetospora sp. NBRC 106378 TaxID=3032208 RepID=UPI0024A4ABB4|nr:DUF397 domain-containing protein [Actinomycetospora sp. NBRC 106378]GLZ54202.1 DUF397 domain-containing protein [Actinomycetospora sp. NBRC 106378]